MRRLPTVPGRARRLAPLAVGVAALSIAAVGCGGDSSSTGASASEVAGFIPASAPMYGEISTDFEGPQWKQVDTLAKVFPSYPKMKADLQKELNTGDVNFERDVKPLLGQRAALAAIALPPANTVTDTSDPAAAVAKGQTVAVVDLADGKDADAEALLARQTEGTPTVVEGVKVYTQKMSGDTAGKTPGKAAVVDGAIVFADTEADIKAVIQAHKAGGDQVLSGNPRFTDTIKKLPSDTFAQMYMDAGAVLKQQAAGNPQLQQLGLADAANTRVAASLAAEPDGVRIKGVTVGQTQQQAEYSPTLVDKVPADAMAFVGISDFQSQVGQLVKSMAAGAGSGSGDVQQQIDGATAQLQPMLGITLDDLKALANKEQALVVTRGTPLPGVAVALQVDDPARAATTLEALRTKVPPLLQQFQTGTTLPPWKQVQLEGGVQGWDLPLSPTGGVTYGIDGNVAFVGSSPGAVRSVQRPAQPLSQLADFTNATKDMPSKVTGVMWINVGEAVRFAEANGAFQNDAEGLANARKVKSVVAWSTGGSEPTFDGFVRIGD